ncbi:ATP-binding protein [Streptomyces griseoluteus]|uniref:ATP-binding protein n=1 Tax=Streptomyces griseoluteus TaxID=29306 RepID=UPI003433F053
MSTTRPYSPGDGGPEPSSASGMPERGATASEAALSAAPPVVPAEGAPEARGRQVRRLSLHGESGVVPLARDFTRQALYEWGWLPASGAEQRAAAEDVLLVVSELVTNACLHADGPDELLLSCDRKVIRLEITDHGAGQPAPRTPHQAGRPGGHGMFIVQRLSLDWGVVRTSDGSGKTVWAELAAPA